MSLSSGHSERVIVLKLQCPLISDQVAGKVAGNISQARTHEPEAGSEHDIWCEGALDSISEIHWIF